jgi:hypothetical protein
MWTSFGCNSCIPTVDEWDTTPDDVARMLNRITACTTSNNGVSTSSPYRPSPSHFTSCIRTVCVLSPAHPRSPDAVTRYLHVGSITGIGVQEDMRKSAIAVSVAFIFTHASQTRSHFGVLLLFEMVRLTWILTFSGFHCYSTILMYSTAGEYRVKRCTDQERCVSRHSSKSNVDHQMTFYLTMQYVDHLGTQQRS